MLFIITTLVKHFISKIVEGQREHPKGGRNKKSSRATKILGGIFTVGFARRGYLSFTDLLCRLFTKGAKILEFEKLREVVGDFQQLDYAKGE